MNMQTLKDLNPVWFVRESFSFMEGSQSLWRTVIQMPGAYFRYMKYTLIG